jgi:drug/metabolite transporter (DMT)-like permease
LVIGVAGTFSHFCLVKAIASADATAVVPMDFLRVPLTALAGWLLYREEVDGYLVLGAGLILAGNLLNLRQEGASSPAAAVRGMPASAFRDTGQSGSQRNRGGLDSRPR